MSQTCDTPDDRKPHTMTHNKPLKIILTILTLTAILIGWTTWRQHVTAQQQAQQTQTQQHATSNKHTPTPQQQARQRQQATNYETQMRTWGTNPLAPAKQYAKQNAADLLNTLKTPPLGDNPLTSQTSSNLTSDPQTGPTAKSPLCVSHPDGDPCQQTPTSLDYWNTENYAMGSTWKKPPVAKTNTDGTITVTGTVTAILIQDTDTFTSGDWHAITPAWRDYKINDRITITDGKITDITHMGDDHWWINPWLDAWDENMSESMAHGTRIAIPVNGQPEMNLTHAGGETLLAAPATMGDMDGDVDWSLWDGLLGAVPEGTTTQNPM